MSEGFTEQVADLDRRLTESITDCTHLMQEALDRGDEISAWRFGLLRREAGRDWVCLQRLRGVA